MKQVLVSCDENYFWKHAPALIATAHEHKVPLHIALVNPSQSVIRELVRVEDRSIWISHSAIYFDFDKYGFSEEQRRVYYASARFWSGHSQLFSCRADGLLIIDIDSIIMKPVPWEKLIGYPLGIWDREDENLGSTPFEREGMKVLAHLYVADGYHEFLSDIESEIQSYNYERWFVDQKAIYDVWKNEEWFSIPYVNLRDTNIISFDMNQDAAIWTGKGDRKNSNQAYLKAQKDAVWKYQQMFGGF